MKRNIFAACITFAVLSSTFGQNTRIDGAEKYQTIHGFGVNINPQSWNVNPKAVKEVIDSLITGMGCTSFRLMFDDSDWEAVNDNNDPGSYNWTYYDEVYSAPRFTCVWNTIEYLNTRGITDITLSPDGAFPGRGEKATQTIQRRTPALKFTMISPVNETGCFGLEAPVITTNQLGNIFSNLASHLINDSITAVTLTGPDDCYNSFNAHILTSNSTTMSKLMYLGGHEYGDNTSRSEELIYAVMNSDYPDRGVIMSEVNAICYGCDGGQYNSDYGFKNYAGPAYKYVLKHLNAGVAGIQLWEGYDSRYHHPNRTLTWSMWGIFGINDTLRPDVYTKRTHYFVFKQLFSFVRPGFKRIEISTDLPDMTVSAFCDPDAETIVITGKNDNESAQTIEALLKNLPDKSKLKFYYTDDTHNFFRGSDVVVSSKQFSGLIPAHCVFTLVNF